MNIKEIDEINYDSLRPRHSVNLRTMSRTEKNNYLKKYSLYRKLFTEYIIEKLGLQEADLKIKKSGLNFKPNSEVDMDIYQYFSSDILSYFYVRNNIYVERLDEQEDRKLQERLDNKQFELDDDAREYIDKTYKKVVLENPFNTGEKTMVFFGPNSMSFAAESDSIVIGMRYDEFAEDGLSDDEWKEQNKRQTRLLYELFEEIMEESEKTLDIPVIILKYDKYSTLKIKSKETRVKDMDEI